MHVSGSKTSPEAATGKNERTKARIEISEIRGNKKQKWVPSFSNSIELCNILGEIIRIEVKFLVCSPRLSHTVFRTCSGFLFIIYAARSCARRNEIKLGIGWETEESISYFIIYFEI